MQASNKKQTNKQKEREIEDVLRVGEEEDGDIIYRRIRIDKPIKEESGSDENKKYENKEE